MEAKAIEIEGANKHEQRLDAYIRMLMIVYNVDGHGLADLIGMSHKKWDENIAAPWDEKKCSFLFGLAELTGIRLDWFVED